MKNLKIIPLVLFTSLIGITGCNKGGGGGGGGVTPTPDDGKIQINYYLDYNQINTKNTYYTTRVKNGSKLKEPTKPKSKDAPLPEFPVFLGWSRKEIIDDKKDLWNFSTDVVNTEETEFNLFGIWVSEGEQ